MPESKSNVRSYKDAEIIKKVESLSTFKGWKKGKYSVWIRSAEDAYNQFDDKCYNFECAKDGEKPKFHSVDSGTTNAGAQGLKHYDEYNNLGCAVLKSNYMVYDFQYFGFHKNDPKRPAYRQMRAWPYFRDGDKDNKAEEIGKEYADIIGANSHDAGKNNPTLIGGYSVACLVRNNKNQYDAWLKWMNKESLHVVILKED